MLVLQDDMARAEIALRGAELRAWQVGATPLLWIPDPAIWAETAPILFPVVGWTRGGQVVVEGRSYSLGVHGFARHLEFEVLEQWPSHARLRATSSDATRRAYPFDWELEVEYALAGGSIETTLSVRNTGTQTMPCACGLHPGFRWPFAGGGPEDYTITFGERESSGVPIISPEGLLTRLCRRLPLDGRRLPLSSALLASDALCFLDAKSRSLRFGHRSGAAIDIELRGFPHVALWSRPSGAFLSIEAWTGHGDFVDADGDLFTKASMLHLRPRQSSVHKARYSFAPPHLLFR